MEARREPKLVVLRLDATHHHPVVRLSVNWEYRFARPTLTPRCSVSLKTKLGLNSVFTCRTIDRLGLHRYTVEVPFVCPMYRDPLSGPVNVKIAFAVWAAGRCRRTNMISKSPLKGVSQYGQSTLTVLAS